MIKKGDGMPDNKFFNVRNIVIAVIVLLGVAVYAQVSLRDHLQGRLRSASNDASLQGYSMGKSAYQAEMMNGPLSRSAAPASPGVSVPVDRKVIKTASVNLRVKSCDQAQTLISALVTRFNGIVINAQVNRPADYVKSGTAVFRVPPKDLDAVLAELRKLGEVESENVTGEDVTEQYVDLDARLKNFKAVRDRLLKIMDERAREVKDILEVERELARVGGEIESLEGRLKYLDRQVDLSTVTVFFHEEQAVVAQSFHFLDRFKSTIRAAVDAFVNSFNGVIVVVAFFLPLFIWAGIIWGAFLLWKALFVKKPKK